jgi:hypothetical protein
VAHWEPHTIPVITEVAGQVSLVEVVEGESGFGCSDGVE